MSYSEDSNAENHANAAIASFLLGKSRQVSRKKLFWYILQTKPNSRSFLVYGVSTLY